MAGTVVLDDVELREAQRDYLDFLDDEVREGLGLEVLALGTGTQRPNGSPSTRLLRTQSLGPTALASCVVADPYGAGAFLLCLVASTCGSQSLVGFLSGHL